MGYRLYLGLIKKIDHKKLRKLSKEDFLKKYDKDNGGYVGTYDIPEIKTIFELGKYVSFSDREIDSIFSRPDEDNENLIVEKETLLDIIKEYRQSVIEYYSNMAEHEQLHLAERKVNLWTKRPPYKIDGDKIATSDEYEYAIFELVSLYKSIDRDKYYLVYYGY